MTGPARKRRLRSAERSAPKRTAPSRAAESRPNRRAERTAARRNAILAAALDEFATSGFTAARLDDVARRAGVAKGTIYLHFRDKESLFQELIRLELGPFLARLEAAPSIDLPLKAVARMLAAAFVREVYGTRRKDIVRLVIAEGRRFPKIAEFYYREVIGRGLAAMRKLIGKAIVRGEIRGDALVRFPQLLIAPALVAVIWEGLFDRFEPLDPETLMQTHLDLLFKALEETP